MPFFKHSETFMCMSLSRPQQKSAECLLRKPGKRKERLMPHMHAFSYVLLHFSCVVFESTVGLKVEGPDTQSAQRQRRVAGGRGCGGRAGSARVERQRRRASSSRGPCGPSAGCSRPFHGHPFGGNSRGHYLGGPRKRTVGVGQRRFSEYRRPGAGVP